VPRLLQAFGDPRLPSDLRGLPLWQATFQLAGFDLAAVTDEFYRSVRRITSRACDRSRRCRVRGRALRAGRPWADAVIDAPHGAEAPRRSW